MNSLFAFTWWIFYLNYNWMMYLFLQKKKKIQNVILLEDKLIVV